MGNVLPASSRLPGLVGFGKMTAIPAERIDDDHSPDPTSPTTFEHYNSSSHTSSSSGSSTNPSTPYRHEGGPDSTHAGLSRQGLARKLVEEELQTSLSARLAQTLSSQQEEHADAATRLKEEMEARVRLEQALNQKAAELKLYQVQLKKAQGEMFKAQDALVELGRMRDEAEHAAAEARSVARKLGEQRLVDIAREEGRRVGLKEGLVREREVDYIDRGYANLERGATVEEVEDDGSYGRSMESQRSPPPGFAPAAAPPSTQGRGRAPGTAEPLEERVLDPMTVTTPLKIPTLEPSRPEPSQPVTTPTPEPVIPLCPIFVASVGTRPTHKQRPTTPDVWIPVSDRDGMRLPSPHELLPHLAHSAGLPSQPQLPMSVSPPPPHRSPRSQSLMVRPPPSDPHHSDRDSTATGTSYSPVVDRREPHHRRRRSSGSRTPTVISQMDILCSPDYGRERALSSITEERPPAVASPNDTPSVRPLQSNLSIFQVIAASAFTPTDDTPAVGLGSASSLRKSSSMSSDECHISVIPPSCPTLNISSNSFNVPGITTSQHDMLSSEDALHRPSLNINTPPVRQPTVVVSKPPLGSTPFGSLPAKPNRLPPPNPVLRAPTMVQFAPSNPKGSLFIDPVMNDPSMVDKKPPVVKPPRYTGPPSARTTLAGSPSVAPAGTSSSNGLLANCVAITSPSGRPAYM